MWCTAQLFTCSRSERCGFPRPSSPRFYSLTQRYFGSGDVCSVDAALSIVCLVAGTRPSPHTSKFMLSEKRRQHVAMLPISMAMVWWKPGLTSPTLGWKLSIWSGHRNFLAWECQIALLNRCKQLYGGGAKVVMIIDVIQSHHQRCSMWICIKFSTLFMCLVVYEVVWCLIIGCRILDLDGSIKPSICFCVG